MLLSLSLALSHETHSYVALYLFFPLCSLIDILYCHSHFCSKPCWIVRRILDMDDSPEMVSMWPPDFDSDDSDVEAYGAKSFHLPSFAFVRLISYLHASSAVMFARASKYCLGRWLHALKGPRSVWFLQAHTLPVQDIASTITAASIGLSSWGIHVMQSVRVPNVCLRIMAAVWDRIKEIRGTVDMEALQDLYCVEYFCGEGASHKGVQAGAKRMRRTKFEVRGFDIRNDPVYQDLNTDFGFLSALLWLLRLVDFEAMTWFGTVCSSWMWLARGTTRMTYRAPRGNLRAPSVQAGNQMVARTAFLLCVAYAKSLTWVLEQIAKSLIVFHPSLLWLAKNVRSELGLPFWQVQTFMGSFGGHTVQPHHVFSDGAWLSDIRNQHPGRMDTSSSNQGITRTYVDRNGITRCSGGSGLKDTQTYPAIAISAVLDLSHAKVLK